MISTQEQPISTRQSCPDQCSLVCTDLSCDRYNLRRFEGQTCLEKQEGYYLPSSSMVSGPTSLKIVFKLQAIFLMENNQNIEKLDILRHSRGILRYLINSSAAANSLSHSHVLSEVTCIWLGITSDRLETVELM